MSETNVRQLLSRRSFLAAVGTAGAALLNRPVAAAVTQTGTPATAAEAEAPLSLASLRSAVGSTFLLYTTHGPLKARLSKVDEQNSCAQLQRYSAQFSLTCNEDLPQGIYKLDGATLGKMELLLIPGNAGPTRSLVATFCQLRQA